MSELHTALECLRPKDFADIPVNDLKRFIPDIFAKAELIVNSVPPPPNGTPYESSHRARSDANGARCAADLTVSNARRPPHKEHDELHKAWGKPLNLGAKEKATGISVFKMAGHDRHGAWFARTSVHEGLGFAKWKKAMVREFQASLEVQGAPGEGSVRGIGGDRRLEDINVDGLGKLEVYQLSAQFPGPTAPREFITLVLTSCNSLSEASRVGDVVPRHYMVVSIPVTHPDAPPRDGMVLGQYESVEMIREIPIVRSKQTSASTSDLLKHDQKKSRARGDTIGFAESRGPGAKGEKMDRKEQAEEDDPETSPVEWIMITRSDPGGGIPRFMVERGTPGSIVHDATKFLDWACSQEDFPSREEIEQHAEEAPRTSMDREPRLSIADNNGILAGVGTSIADRPGSIRRHSHRTLEGPFENSVLSTMDPAMASTVNSLHRTESQSSTTSSSSLDSFASAEQFNTAQEDLSLSTMSGQSIPVHRAGSPTPSNKHTTRELQKIEQKRQQLNERLHHARNKESQVSQDASLKSAKDIEKATEKHKRERQKQEEKFAKEVQKLEARRERETRKLLARQQKEADKTALNKAQRERDEYKQRAELVERELGLLKAQVGELQRENTAVVAKLGKVEGGLEMLRRVREELSGKSGRNRASSRSSGESAGKKGRRQEASAVEGSGG